MLSKSIGTNIKQFRTQKGYSQDDLAERLCVTRQTVSNYETGKTFPDIDTLQLIATELDVELTWLLYGKPVPLWKKEELKKTIIFVVALTVLAILTWILYAYTKELRYIKLIVMPNVLTRIILFPLCSGLCGVTLLQILDCFFGITRPKKQVRKIGGTITLCILGINLLLVLPYIIWCLYVLWQMLVDDGSVSAYFPNVPIYQAITQVLLSIMYKGAYAYAVFGMALWLFFPGKANKEKSNSEKDSI